MPSALDASRDTLVEPRQGEKTIAMARAAARTFEIEFDGARATADDVAGDPLTLRRTRGDPTR